MNGGVYTKRYVHTVEESSTVLPYATKIKPASNIDLMRTVSQKYTIELCEILRNCYIFKYYTKAKNIITITTTINDLMKSKSQHYILQLSELVQYKHRPMEKQSSVESRLPLAVEHQMKRFSGLL